MFKDTYFRMRLSETHCKKISNDTYKLKISNDRYQHIYKFAYDLGVETWEVHY